MTIPRAQEGRPVSASAFNTLASMVERMASGAGGGGASNIRAGAGLRTQAVGGAVIISLAQAFPDLVTVGTIVERTPAGGGVRKASDVAYIVRAIHAPSIEVDTSDTAVQVLSRRIRREQADKVNIYVAELGTICGIVRWPYVGAEKVAVWIAGGEEGEVEHYAEQCQ